jgi:hypothetical protein
VTLRSRRRERRVAEAIISDPTDHTEMDQGGAVRSVQSAFVRMPAEEALRLWSPMYLERLARTYWWYLSRISLGLIRVHYTATQRAVVLLAHPLVLLRFRAPEYDLDPDRGVVRWRIQDGLLVAGRDAGWLEIDVRRCPADHSGYERVHVEVEVANFYPALARPFRWFYTNTQSRIHVIVTHGFLKRLARMELEESAVGRFAEPQPEPAGAPALSLVDGSANGHQAPADAGAEDVTVGSTPWGVVAALVAAFALAGFLVGWILRGERLGAHALLRRR